PWPRPSARAGSRPLTGFECRSWTYPAPARENRTAFDIQTHSGGSMANPQTAIGTPDTGDAIFLVQAVRPGAESVGRVVQVCSELEALVRAVGARDPRANLSAIVAFGSDVWDRLFGAPRPRELHP